MGIPFNRETGPHGGSLGIPPEQFRETVRMALGRQSGPPAEPYDVLMQELPEIEEQAQSVRQRIAQERAELLDKLAETAGLRGWNVQRCDGVEEALDYVSWLVRSLGATSVARSEQPVFDTVPVDAAVAGAGGLCWPAVYDGPASRNDVRQRLAESGMGITGADYAIAETGSVVVLPRQRTQSPGVGGAAGARGNCAAVRRRGHAGRPVHPAEAGVRGERRRDGKLPELHHRPQPHRGHRTDDSGGRARAARGPHGAAEQGVGQCRCE